MKPEINNRKKARNFTNMCKLCTPEQSVGQRKDQKGKAKIYS